MVAGFLESVRSLVVSLEISAPLSAAVVVLQEQGYFLAALAPEESQVPMGLVVPPTALSVLRLLILPQWSLLPTSGKPDFLWLAVLESDLAVCAQFLGSSRCCGSE